MKWMIALIILTGVISCTNNSNTETVYINTNSSSGAVIADTIIYDVIIKNTTPDDEWSRLCLQNIDRKVFVDQLFNNIYNGDLKAFHYLSGDIILPETLKQLETQDQYSRDAIGKLQFAEVWRYNDSLQVFNKEVISIIVGTENFDNSGNLKGYRPLFKVYLN